MATNVESEVDRILQTVSNGFLLPMDDQRVLVDYVRKSRMANQRRQEMINKLAACLDERDSGTSKR